MPLSSLLLLLQTALRTATANNSLPATALGFNPADPEIMRQRPRKREEELISKWTFARYMVVGTYVGFATVAVFVCVAWSRVGWDGMHVAHGWILTDVAHCC